MQSVILGTAQWGLDYGVTNQAGRLSDAAILALVAAARDAGIGSLDTAPAYGDAEERIGVLADGFSVQTKVSVAGSSATAVPASVAASLGRVRSARLRAVLVHDWTSASPRARIESAGSLEQLREDGVIESVGVSAYGREDVDSALTAFQRLDVVQAPVSILDQRLEESPELAEVRSRGGRVQARSILLQGAAVAAENHSGFGRHPDVIRLRSTGRALHLCLGYVASRPWVDELVLAATTAAELSEIMAAIANPVPPPDWSAFASSDPRLVDPRRWTLPSLGR